MTAGHRIPYMEAWAKRIKSLMDAETPPVSVSALARDIGLKQTSVRQWFKPDARTGKTTSMITSANAMAVARRFNVSLEWIMTGRSPVADSAMPKDQHDPSPSGLSEPLLADALELWARVADRTDLGGGSEAGALIAAYDALLLGKDELDATTAIWDYAGKMGGGYGRRGEAAT